MTRAQLLAVLLPLSSPLLLGCGSECAKTLTCEGFPRPLWLRGGGMNGADQSHDVALDGDNNAFVVGSLGAPNGGSGESLYMAKYAPADGSEETFAMAQSDGFARATAVTADEDQSIIVAGVFEGTLTFGDNALAANDGRALFVAKLADDGIPTWSMAIAGAESIEVNALDVLGTSIFVAGQFSGALELSPTLSLTSANTSEGSPGRDGFVVELSSEGGAVAGAWKAGAEGEDAVTGVAVHSDGIALCGYFTSSMLTLGTDHEHSNEQGPQGKANLWVATLSSLYSLDELQQMQAMEEVGAKLKGSLSGVSAEDDRCLDIDILATEEGDRLIMTGYYGASGQLGDEDLDYESASQERLLVARLTSNAATVDWVSGALGSSSSRGNALASPDAQSIAVAASFGSGTFVLDDLSFPSPDAPQPLLLSFDSAGVARTGITSTTGSQAASYADAMNKTMGIASMPGRVVATGSYSSAELDFCPPTTDDDQTWCDFTPLSSAGDDDIFVVAVDQ